MRCDRANASLDEPPLQIRLVDVGPSPEEAALAREEQERVQRALAQLPETQRQIVELRLIGLRTAEIADVLGMSESQAMISPALVIIVLVGLAGIVMQQQTGPSRGHHQLQMVSASPTMSDETFAPQVPERCVANGSVTSSAELKTRSITDRPTPEYTPVQTVSYDQGLAIQKTFLSYTRCEWNALHSATPPPPATPEPPVLAMPILLTYFSDRRRYDRLFHQLSPSQQQQLATYRYLPRIDKLLASFPLPVNQPLDRAKADSNPNDASVAFVPIFSPSDVYRLADGRYAAIVGSISTAALTDPNAVTTMDTLQFIVFSQSNGRNSSLATDCP